MAVTREPPGIDTAADDVWTSVNGPGNALVAPGMSAMLNPYLTRL